MDWIIHLYIIICMMCYTKRADSSYSVLLCFYIYIKTVRKKRRNAKYFWLPHTLQLEHVPSILLSIKRKHYFECKVSLCCYAIVTFFCWFSFAYYGHLIVCSLGFFFFSFARAYAKQLGTCQWNVAVVWNDSFKPDNWHKVQILYQIGSDHR